MSISVSKDQARPAGFAFIDVGAAPPAGDVEFRIERNHPALPHLGPAGWQAAPALLRPLSVAMRDTSMRIEVGPEVVNEIGEYEQVRFYLPANGFDGQVVWPPIPPLTRARGTSVVSNRPKPPLDKPAIGDGFGPPISPPPPLSPPPLSAWPVDPTAGDPPAGPPLSVGSKKSRWVLLVAALLLCLIAAGAAWHFYGDRAGPAVADRTVPPPAGTAPPVTAAEVERPWREVVLDPKSDGEMLYALGLKLAAATPPNWDGAIEAMTAAEDRRHVAAALWIGRAYDPRKDLWRSLFGEANANNAMRHYMTSKDGGSAEATAEIDELCKWLDGRKLNGTPDEKRAHQNYCAF